VEQAMMLSGKSVDFLVLLFWS